MGTSGISAFRIPPIAKRCARNPLWEFTQKMQIDGRGIAMPIRAGVLIIGSLLWDGRHGRPRWRQRRLDVSARQQVWAPIRYGRFSNCRKTYTMVFSRLCYRQCCLGIAQVVPCVKPIRSPNDLIEEAACLANAEGLNKWTWGAIGILTSPRANAPKDILDTWRTYFTEKARGCEVFSAHAESQSPVLSDNGILRIHWPTPVSRDTEVTLDLLLATATAPTMYPFGGQVRRYARPDEIGRTYAETLEPEYFLKNVRNGIRTNQDVRILTAMVRKHPEWEHKYADVGKLLSG